MSTHMCRVRKCYSNLSHEVLFSRKSNYDYHVINEVCKKNKKNLLDMIKVNESINIQPIQNQINFRLWDLRK